MTEYDITNIVGWPSQPEMDKYLAVARFAGKEKEQRIAELEAQCAAMRKVCQTIVDMPPITSSAIEQTEIARKALQSDAGAKLLAELEALRELETEIKNQRNPFR